MDSIELKIEDLEKVVGGQQQRISGFDCPQCGSFIPTTMEQIIKVAALVCPRCGLRLNIDNAKTVKTIEALIRLTEQQKKTE